jgi:cyclic beta-1,2-glucan synthetase
MVQATELLLQERTPRDVAVVRPWAVGATSRSRSQEGESSGARQYVSAGDATPATHLLSNGRYAVMLTTAG